MYKLMIFDQNENFTGTVNKVLSARTYSELNGEDSITISITGKYVEKGYRILCHDRVYDKYSEYIIRDIDEGKENGVVVTEIYAENSISETLGDFIEDKRNINKSSDYALKSALEGTRWDVGDVPSDNLGTTTFYRTNVRSAIDDIVREYELELETEIGYNRETYKISRKLHLRKRVGEKRGLRITYTRHIKELKRRTLSDEIFTALYGFGKGEETESGGYGRRISFADINDGKGYVVNEEALEKFGRIGRDGKKMHSYGKVEFDNITDKKLLKEKTEEMLVKMSKPSVSYEISINDFYQVTKSKDYYISLGDDVFVIDKDFNPEIRYETRVLSIERDLVNKEESTVILGQLVRNITDTEDEVIKEIEDINEEELPDWEEDPGSGEEGPGELPSYEKASDMVKKYPTLKVGLISWMDSNEPTSLDMSGKKVVGVRDAVTKEVIYTQNDVNKAPTTRVIDGRRYVNFDREDIVMRRWPVSEGEYGRPQGLPNQKGIFMNNELSNKKIKSVTVVYEDRRPMLQSEMFPEDWENPNPALSFISPWRKAENYYNVGRQSPLGYPFGAIPWECRVSTFYINAYEAKPLLTLDNKSEYELAMKAKEEMRHSYASEYSKSEAQGYFTIDKYSPDEGHVIAISSNIKYGEHVNMLYIGMSKERYEDYAAFRSIGGWADEAVFYEMNTFFRGAIAEIILHDRELSKSEKRILQQYVEDKYDFDVDVNFLSTI